MALDYGLKRVGVALSDPLRKFAYPFNTLNNDSKLIDNLVNIVNEMNVETILIGIPNDFNSNTNSLYDKIIEFKNILSKRLNINILLWDESYSSKIAFQKIIESVPKKKKRRDKALIDMHSAAVMLSEYLEQLEV